MELSQPIAHSACAGLHDAPEFYADADSLIEAPRPNSRKTNHQTPAREEPMPTFEQVERSMQKAMRLRFNDDGAHQAERNRQIAEGRKMSACENQPPRRRPEERAPRAAKPPIQTENQAPAPKKRSRNRPRKARAPHQTVGA